MDYSKLSDTYNFESRGAVALAIEIDKRIHTLMNEEQIDHVCQSQQPLSP